MGSSHLRRSSVLSSLTQSRLSYRRDLRKFTTYADFLFAVAKLVLLVSSDEKLPPSSRLGTLRPWRGPLEWTRSSSQLLSRHRDYKLMKRYIGEYQERCLESDGQPSTRRDNSKIMVLDKESRLTC